MPTTDPRIDAYIANAQPFAKPILEHLRAVVHAACPDCVENIKWGFPHFDYKGIMCSMAAFKAHCAFGFWNPGAIPGLTPSGEPAMGTFGRITTLKELPSDRQLTAFIKAAMKNNDAGVKPVRDKMRRQGTKPPAAKLAKTPAYLAAALKKDAKARATWDNFSPSHRKEYVEWLVEAKQDATREKRLATTLEWLREGKSRNWKYQRAKG
ncbi:MAG: YdeI/OmpD-associated family protein [Gemmatimonadetes bacterium]|nr:YdeI/OmpD-associated family protein [Gemmatimonadota bacterium]